jgi:AraC-like DNA-binding protein
MVKSGQLAGKARIVPVAYQNATRPGSELEVMRLSDIVRRGAKPRLEQLHRMEFHQLAVYVSGRTQHIVDFEPHACGPGTVIHSRPGQVEQWKLAPGVDAVLAVFTPSFLFVERPRVGALWHERFFDDFAWPSAMQMKGPDKRALDEWLVLLEHLYGSVDASPASAALLRHVVSALLLDLARRSGLNEAPPSLAAADVLRMRQFRQDLERSFRVTRSVGDYAQRLKCSLKTLDRACRAMNGLSAKAAIDSRVALEARRLLAHTSLTVAAIGEDLGFSEPTNFVKFFKARTGQLPGEFRAQLR